MFVLNYKKQFAPAVRSGEKRQTIRAPRKDGKLPKPGEMLRHYTGMRTNACEHLLDSVCASVAPVHVFDEAVMVGGQRLTVDECVALAKADGFATPDEFVEFFSKNHKLPFEGHLIKW